MADQPTNAVNKKSNLKVTDTSFYQEQAKDSRSKHSKHVVELSPTEFKCVACDRVFARKASCYAHIYYRHDKQVDLTDFRDDPKVVRCPHCPNIYSKKSNLYTHIREIHKLEPLASETRRSPHVMQCPICKLNITAMSGSLLYHLRTKHGHHRVPPGPPKPFSCDMCDQKFSHNKTRRLHMRKVHGLVVKAENKDLPESKYSCKICKDATFSRRSNILRHIKRLHGLLAAEKHIQYLEAVSSDEEVVVDAAAEKKYYCQSCEMSFGGDATWSSHMRSIHKCQPETCCSECGAHSFSTISELKAHITVMHNIAQNVDSNPNKPITLLRSSMGLIDTELRALLKIPDWLVKRASGQLIVAVHRDL